MFRILCLLSILFFLVLVIIGVNTTTNHFNRHVLPEEPLRAFEVFRTSDDIVEIHLLGERVEFDYQENLASVKREAREQWEQMINSERVRAVNQWVKEKF